MDSSTEEPAVPNHNSTPPEHTYRSRAALKRNAAAKRRHEAARLDADAELLERKWAEYVVRRDAAPKQATA
jgi:hypothetical protein